MSVLPTPNLRFSYDRMPKAHHHDHLAVWLRDPSAIDQRVAAWRDAQSNLSLQRQATSHVRRLLSLGFQLNVLVGSICLSIELSARR
jgi:hypothetical protein